MHQINTFNLLLGPSPLSHVRPHSSDFTGPNRRSINLHGRLHWQSWREMQIILMESAAGVVETESFPERLCVRSSQPEEVVMWEPVGRTRGRWLGCDSSWKWRAHAALFKQSCKRFSADAAAAPLRRDGCGWSIPPTSSWLRELCRCGFIFHASHCQSARWVEERRRSLHRGKSDFKLTWKILEGRGGEGRRELIIDFIVD